MANNIRVFISKWLTPFYTNAIYIWTTNIVLGLLGLAFWVLAARIYSTKQVGLATSLVQSMVLIGRLCFLGLGMSMVRYISQSKDSGIRLINSSTVITVILTLFASIIYLVGIPLWAPALRPLCEQPYTIILYVVFTVCLSISALYDQVFVGIRQSKYLLIKCTILSVIRVALICSLAFIPGYFGIVTAYSIPTILGVIIIATVVFRRIIPSFRLTFARLSELPAGFKSFTIINHFAFLFLYAPTSLFPIILLNTTGAESSAYFFVAWSITTPFVSVGVSLAMSLLAEGSKDRTKLRSHLKGGFLAGSLITGLGLIIVLVAPQLPLMLYGKEYASEAVQLLRILTFASIFGILPSVYIAIAQIQKYLKDILIVSLITFLVSCVGSYFLSLQYGATGAAYACLAAQILGAIYAGIRLYKIRTNLTTSTTMRGSKTDDS